MPQSAINERILAIKKCAIEGLPKLGSVFSTDPDHRHVWLVTSLRPSEIEDVWEIWGAKSPNVMQFDRNGSRYFVDWSQAFEVNRQATPDQIDWSRVPMTHCDHTCRCCMRLLGDKP